MGIEIERKFLLTGEDWKENIKSKTEIKQGYLNTDKTRTVRVRIRANKGYLTIKGKSNTISRPEYEYEIPYSDALELLKLCDKPIIAKHRYEVEYKNHLWEIDVFEDENKGLIFAEIELNSENETFEKPSWIGKEVSKDSRYHNSSLVKRPYSDW